MRELPGALRDPIFHQLVELLSTKFCSWEMVAMVFLVEVSNSCRSSECGAAGPLHQPCCNALLLTHSSPQSYYRIGSKAN